MRLINNRSFWFGRCFSAPKDMFKESGRVNPRDTRSDRNEEKKEYRLPTWDEEELEECRDRIMKLEKRLRECSFWFTAERKEIKQKIREEEKRAEKIMSRIAGSGYIEVR